MSERHLPEPRTLALTHRGHTFPVRYRHSPGRDETVFYFHGLGSALEDFDGAWDQAGWHGYGLLAFDAPGCGHTRSRPVGVPLGVDDIVVVAERLAEHLGLGKLTVVGHSMGGLAALLFVRRNPGSVRRLVNVEGNLGPADCAVFSRGVYEKPFLGREDEFLGELAGEMARSGAPGFELFAGAFRERVQPLAFFDYCRSLVERCDSEPLLEHFMELELPKLYVHGDRNAGLPHLPRLRDHPGVEVAVVPESDHFPAYSNPQAYYRALVSFTEATAA